MSNRNTADVTEELISKLTRTKANVDFVKNINDSMITRKRTNQI